jgi:hypothetical protein
MGAEAFYCRGVGVEAADAFDHARGRAWYDYGHAGYTGTIAEKETFIVISDKPHTLDDARATASALINSDDQRVSDKWGPAGAIRLDATSWLFFGWASS